MSYISIHALREESDQSPTLLPWGFGLFQSTPSARRATTHIQDTHTSRVISIHALREESDGNKARQSLCHRYFNPRPPRGERPQIAFFKAAGSLFQSTPSARRATPARVYFGGGICQFQSTPSARRATYGHHQQALRLRNFNPRPPRGERRSTRESGPKKPNFNPRPPRGERRCGIKSIVE